MHQSHQFLYFMTVFVFAFFTPLINTIVFVLQLMALISVLQASGAFSQNQTGIESAASSIAIIYFMISGYWTSEVTKNISTVLVSGTVGTWWFAPIEASSFCSSAVVDSFKRATTYSFGSICFGSLLVAILNVVIDAVKRLRRNRGCVLLSCVLTCLLSFLERLAEYFNKWAFVYVGLYGYDYMTAGKFSFKRNNKTSLLRSDHEVVLIGCSSFTFPTNPFICFRQECCQPFPGKRLVLYYHR